jgi:hypothetical protein
MMWDDMECGNKIMPAKENENELVHFVDLNSSWKNKSEEGGNLARTCKD